MKKIIILIIVIGLAGSVVYFGFLKKESATFDLAEAKVGKIIQEVSETGQVQKGDKINLSFKTSGVITNIYIDVGEEVKKGDILARLETSNLSIQLQESQAALDVAQAQLNQLLAGASEEEIKIAKTAVENSEIDLDTAEQTLTDAYDDSLYVLNDAYLKAYNSQNTVALIKRTYFTTSDQEGIEVKEDETSIGESVSSIKSFVDNAQLNPTPTNIDSALSTIKTELNTISIRLKDVRENCETVAYQNLVSSTDKTSLDTHRTNINTAVTNVVNSQQTIASAKLGVESAEGSLQAAKDNLSSVTAEPRKENIALKQAQVKQAEAAVSLLENQVRDATLRSPVAGQVAEIKKREGELVQPVLQDTVVVILPTSPYEIDADVYEEDVVKVNIDNEVGISLVAFPEKTFTGRVISIYPAEKLIEGVIYYKVVVAFDTVPEGIKPGMTADLIIKTAEKENVLIIPKDALYKENGKTFVKVLKDEIVQDKDVQVGLVGADNNIEI
ncbi:MAG: hypothetical protein A2175_01240, partial [Candidatus Nealsonbacteria bacterium RBG_13_42_11]